VFYRHVLDPVISTEAQRSGEIAALKGAYLGSEVFGAEAAANAAISHCGGKSAASGRDDKVGAGVKLFGVGGLK
jgi:hypothetical protein